MSNCLSDFAKIDSLDLEPIKVKLMHRPSGEGWSLARANAAEVEYRRFLYLMKKFPQEQAGPSTEVDTFWHYHILDTQKYAQDCHAVFGYFLHHFPYVGLRGEDDLDAHERVGARMRLLYEDTFGEAYPVSTAAVTSSTGTAFCVRTESAFCMATAGLPSSLARPRLPHGAASGPAPGSAQRRYLRRTSARRAG